MSLPTVLCLSPTFGTTAREAVREIEAAGATLIRGPRSAILREARALIVGLQPVDAELLERAPNLVIVAKHGAGIDNIDVAAATDAGVAVTSAPGANATAVAELTMGLIVALARGILHEDVRVRQGRWDVATGKALHGSILGIVGLGRIGRLVAHRAAAFNMHILAYDVALNDARGTLADLCTMTDPETLLRDSDFVTLHVPLTPDTEHLIDKRALGLMKSTAYLINTARGGIVDEKALTWALTEGVIAGAALDVFAQEPLHPNHPLVEKRDRTILTPHMGAYTDRDLAETSMVTARNVVAALTGNWPPDAVNAPLHWRGRAYAGGGNV